MALSAKHRSTIYERLSPVLGEEEAEALLSQFPSRDLDEPVTKEFVRAEIGDARSDLRSEIAELRTELHDRLREQAMWMSGTLIAGMGVAATIGSLVG